MDILTILILPIHKHSVYFYFFYHFQFLSSTSYSFQSTSCLLPWLNLFHSFDAIIDGLLKKFSLLDSALLVYRNAIYFCIFILYSETSLNSFISFNHQHFYPQRKLHQIPVPLAHTLKLVSVSSRMIQMLFKLLPLHWDS